MVRVLGLALAALALPACLEGGGGLSLGRPCGSSGDCEEGLLCVYGRCRSPCSFEADCPEGGSCVASPDDPEVRVCTRPEEDGEGACPEGLSCDGAVWRNECDEGEEGACGAGRTCVGGLCLELPADADGDADGDAEPDAEVDGDGDGGPTGWTPHEPPWVRCFGEGAAEAAASVAFDPATSDLVVAGASASTLDLDGLTFEPEGQDGYVATFGLDGTARSLERLGGPGEDTAVAVEVSGDGVVTVVGTFEEEVGLGGLTAESAGGADVFVAQLADRGPALRAFGGLLDERANDAALLAGGDVAIAGQYFGAPELDGAATLPDAAEGGGLVLVVDPSLALHGAHGAAGTSEVALLGVAGGNAGRLLLAGYYTEHVELGGCELDADPGSAGYDMLAASLAPGGACAWTPIGGGTPGTDMLSAVVEVEGGALFVGSTAAGVDDTDLFAMTVDAVGDVSWYWLGGPGAGPGRDAATALALLSTGEALAAGFFQETIDLGGAAPPLDAEGGFDVFLATIDPATGEVRDARGLGGPGDDLALDVAVDAEGRVAVVGRTDGDLTLGETSCGAASGAGRSFVALFAP